jgi:twitching motility two-component system response regulator PilH
MAVNKVLVVDDSPAHLELLKNVVSGAGCRVLVASSGKEAVELTKAEKPDLVLMDIVMDDMDGYGACREIIADSDTKDIPVVFVSSKKQRADCLWAEKQGARGLISKPFKDEEILETLNKF